MGPVAITALVILAAYLLGAVPFGYVVGRWRGVDIMHQGSGNIGATNVGRVLGKRYGLLVFVLDFAKGAIPTAVACSISRQTGEAITGVRGPDGLGVAAGLAAFLGHLFPVYLRFRGGKGVATGAGVVSVLLPLPALGALATWVGVVWATRFVSLASLSAVVALFLIHLALSSGPYYFPPDILTWFCLLALVLVFLRHAANIRRLLHGTENRVRNGPAMQHVSKTIHVLAVGLWFGSLIFFTIATTVIFWTLEDLGHDAARPRWLTGHFDVPQGEQLAGIVVSPLFDFYLPLQVVCGFLALCTAANLCQFGAGQRVHRLRVLLLALALACVLGGWPLAHHLGQLRHDRYSPDLELADGARAAFAALHLWSLLFHMVTLALVSVAMALAAQLPAPIPELSVKSTERIGET